MDIATISGLLSGAGSFASGLSSLFGGGGPSPRKQMAEAYNMKIRELTELPSYQVRGYQYAGIHPLYGMGTQPIPFNPQVIGQESKDIGGALERMGQGIDRAAAAYSSKKARAVADASAELTLENQQLQNEALRTQIAGSRQAIIRSGATVPLNDNTLIAGQGDAIQVNPSETVRTALSNRGTEAATAPSNKLYIGFDGRPMISPSPDYAESMEGNWPVGMLQNLGHNTIPFYSRMFAKWLKRQKYTAYDRGNYTEYVRNY